MALLTLHLDCCGHLHRRRPRHARQNRSNIATQEVANELEEKDGWKWGRLLLELRNVQGMDRQVVWQARSYNKRWGKDVKTEQVLTQSMHG